MAYKRSLFR